MIRFTNSIPSIQETRGILAILFQQRGCGMQTHPSTCFILVGRAENQGLQCALKPFNGGSQTRYGIW
jgi:hypothetical protein